MGKPVTPLVGADLFVQDEHKRILLIKRKDNSLWALPGGCQDLGETPKECAEREFFEETGMTARVTQLLGVFSSTRYEYVHYPWKENEFCHLLFAGEVTGGEGRETEESFEVQWFSPTDLPPLSDGHEIRIRYAISAVEQNGSPYFE